MAGTKANKKVDRDALSKALISDEEIEQSRTTLATGGGEPIKKGHKRTTEKRVLQPRDSEGKFDYNASAGISRKYVYHAERNGTHNGQGGGGKFKTLPSAIRNKIVAYADLGMKRGDVFMVGDKRFIAAMDMSDDELRSRIDSLSGINETTSKFITKRGRMTNKEYEMSQKGKGGVIKKERPLTKITKDRIKEALKYVKSGGAGERFSSANFAKQGAVYEESNAWGSGDFQKGKPNYVHGNQINPNGGINDQGLDPQTLASNQAYNAAKDKARSNISNSLGGQNATPEEKRTLLKNAIMNGGYERFAEDLKTLGYSSEDIDTIKELSEGGDTTILDEVVKELFPDAPSDNKDEQ